MRRGRVRGGVEVVEMRGAAGALTERLRAQIAAGIHVGSIVPGDRLPSYREVADTMGAHLREIAAAYAALEREGLVEVRLRSGVFLAGGAGEADSAFGEEGRWFTEVLLDAWSRRLPAPRLPALAAACVSVRPVRCTVVDGTVDQAEWIAAEVRDAFGFEVMAVSPEPGTSPRGTPALPAMNQITDVLATTAFHAADLRGAATLLGVPLVVVGLHGAFIQMVREAVAEGELTVVCVDPRFGDQIRLIADEWPRDRVRTVLASDAEAVRQLDRSHPALVSEAARRVLPAAALPPTLRSVPLISRDSAWRFAQQLVRVNLEAGVPDGDSASCTA